MLSITECDEYIRIFKYSNISDTNIYSDIRSYQYFDTTIFGYSFVSIFYMNIFGHSFVSKNYSNIFVKASTLFTKPTSSHFKALTLFINISISADLLASNL